MNLNDQEWAEIVAMTRAAISSWQASAAAMGLPDRFSIFVSTRDCRSVIFTRHTVDGAALLERCIMRFEGTDSVFPCKWDVKQKKWKPRPAPQGWLALRGKPLERIWKALKLCDFQPLRKEHLNVVR